MSETARGPWKRGLGKAAALGAMHAAVDAASGVVLGRWLPDIEAVDLVVYFLLYDALAFAVQPLLGLLSDGTRRPRVVALAGLALCAVALAVPGDWPWWAVAVTGLGNAAFHVGAGVMASAATPGRASGAGVFIGPGALGVVLGKVAGDAADPMAWVFALALLVSAGALARLPAGPVTWPTPDPPARSPRSPAVAAALLLGAIAVRAIVGFAAVAGLAADPDAGSWLAVGACAGKMAGGFVADRFGWRLTAVVTLAGAAALFGLGGDRLAPAVAGMVLFQGVTGVTLAGLCRIWPRRLGLGFGLACLALFVGSLPTLLDVAGPGLAAPEVVVALTLAAALAIWLALAAVPASVLPWNVEPPAGFSHRVRRSRSTVRGSISERVRGTFR